MLYLFHIQFHTVNMVVTVKSTIHTVIFTIIGYVKRCEEIYCIAKMFACFYTSFLCHFFQKRFCCWRKQCLEILYGACFMRKSSTNIASSVDRVIKRIHLCHNLLTNIRFNLFHIRQIFHVIFTARSICF